MTVAMDPALASAGAAEGLVSVRIGGQAFGVPVLSVQDVIAQTAINRVPLGPAEVAGSLNLRGRIVTAIDMRRRLGMEPKAAEEGAMSVIVERNGELYALLVDDVGDVLWLPESQHEQTPVTLAADWRRLCSGLYRLEGELLLVLKVEEVLLLDPAGPVRRAAAPSAAATPVEARPAQTLFERLGGAPAVEAAVELFYRKVLADDRISGYFARVDMKRQIRSQRAFLTMLMGGPNAYTGANLRAAHQRMVGLDDSHFDAVVAHLAATLKELGAADADIAEAGALAESARADVLNR